MRCLAFLLPLLVAPPDLAEVQAGGDYTITRSVVAGGGDVASADAWSLSGSSPRCANCS